MALREPQGYLVVNNKLWICNCSDDSAGARGLKDLQRQMPKLNMVIEHFKVKIVSTDRMTGNVNDWEKDEGCSLWIKT